MQDLAAYGRWKQSGMLFLLMALKLKCPLKSSKSKSVIYNSCETLTFFSVDKKNQLDVTFCILYFSSNSCSTCFGQPCAHHQELTTA